MSKPIFQEVFVIRSGRRNRLSFLAINLFLLTASIFLSIAMTIFGAQGRGSEGLLMVLSIPILVYSICAFVAMLSALAQRCRDIGWSGWWSILAYLPFIGIFFTLLLLFLPGTVGANKFGPDPR